MKKFYNQFVCLNNQLILGATLAVKRNKIIKGNAKLVRNINRAIILNLVREKQQVSRAQISKITKLNKSTVSSIVSELLKNNYLVEELIADNKIVVLQGDPQQQAKLLQKLKRYDLDGLDPGELESITIICEDLVPDLKFCLKERLATKVMACLNRSQQAISIEEVLRDNGIIGKKEFINKAYSKKRIEAVLLEGVFKQVEIDG